MNKLTAQWALVASNLKESGALVGYAGKADPIEQETAYAVCEVVESARKIVEVLFPKLLATADAESHREALEDFREEIRHIYYHVADSDYMSVVV